jgi:hypothetical protein
LVALGMLVAPVRARAQCAFDAPVKAAGFKSSMVRAYAGCPSITFPGSNTSTMAGVPGCAPPFALSDYQFADEKSGCSIQLSHNLKDPCPSGDAVECADIRVKAKCTGVLESDGLTPASGPGWVLNLSTRITWDDQTRGDMTVIDSPAQFSFSEASGGTLKLDFSIYDLLCLLFFGCPSFPACLQNHVLSASILDPDGNVFAVLGSSSR